MQQCVWAREQGSGGRGCSGVIGRAWLQRTSLRALGPGYLRVLACSESKEVCEGAGREGCLPQTARDFLMSLIGLLTTLRTPS